MVDPLQHSLLQGDEFLPLYNKGIPAAQHHLAWPPLNSDFRLLNKRPIGITPCCLNKYVNPRVFAKCTHINKFIFT